MFLWNAIGQVNHFLMWSLLEVDFWNRILHRFANIKFFLLYIVNREAMQRGSLCQKLVVAQLVKEFLTFMKSQN